MNSENTIEGILFDGYRVVIDAGSPLVGGSWEGIPARGIPTAHDMTSLKFFFERTLEHRAPVLMDIGANTGSFSLLPCINPDITGYAFEPAPDIFNILKRNLALNRLETHIEPLSVALSNESGTACLKCPASGRESGLACLGEPLRFHEWTEVHVPMTTVDALAEEKKIDQVHLIKIDTEGCELFVLQGAEGFIRECHPQILTESNDRNTMQFGYRKEEIRDLLFSWGYRCIAVGEEDLFFFRPGQRVFSFPYYPALEKGETLTENTALRNRFTPLIEKLGRAQHRLYYRDQSIEMLLLLAKFVEEFDPTKIIELGTLSGLSLRAWLEAGNKARITAVDLSFDTLRQTHAIVPIDEARVDLLEQDILATDFKALWGPRDRVIFYIDAHDLPQARLMNYLLDKAIPFLPGGSLVVIDDLWFSPARLTRETVSDFFEKRVLNEIDPLQDLDCYYAPYWKGGTFLGFLEVIPLMEWVNTNRVQLFFHQRMKLAAFEWPSECTARASDAAPFDAEFTGAVAYNPVGAFRVIRNKESDRNKHGLELCRQGVFSFQRGAVSEALSRFEQVLGMGTDILWLHYAAAVCLARIGDMESAGLALNQELSTPSPHPGARKLFEDIQRAGNRLEDFQSFERNSWRDSAADE